MSGYKAGYSEAHSPMYLRGRADAMSDNAREAAGQDPFGPTPPFPENRVMYDRGYQSVRG